MEYFPIVSQNKNSVGFYEYLEIDEVWQTKEGVFRVPYKSLEQYTITENEQPMKLYAIFAKKKDGIAVKLGEYYTLERAREVLYKEIIGSFGHNHFIEMPEK